MSLKRACKTASWRRGRPVSQVNEEIAEAVQGVPQEGTSDAELTVDTLFSQIKEKLVDHVPVAPATTDTAPAPAIANVTPAPGDLVPFQRRCPSTCQHLLSLTQDPLSPSQAPIQGAALAGLVGLGVKGRIWTIPSCV